MALKQHLDHNSGRYNLQKIGLNNLVKLINKS